MEKTTGFAIAPKQLVENKLKVKYMYRQLPDNPHDSGWRFFSGDETNEFVNNPINLDVYDIKTITQIDPDIIPFLNSETSTAFERDSEEEPFHAVNRIKSFDEFSNIIDSNITGDYYINFCNSNSSALDKEQNEVNYTAVFGCLDFFLEYFNGDNYEKPEVYFHVSWNHFTKYDWDEIAKFEILIKEIKQIIKELES